VVCVTVVAVVGSGVCGARASVQIDNCNFVGASLSNVLEKCHEAGSGSLLNIRTTFGSGIDGGSVRIPGANVIGVAIVPPVKHC
jgi:hypothetical protein